jgi:hypothetical protein
MSVIVIFSTVIWFTALSTYEKTNDIYVIPDGYEGSIFVFSDVPGAPVTQREGQFDVFLINEEGYYVTSTSAHRLGFGLVTDQYMYVDAAGVRTPIPQNCARTLATGGGALNDEAQNSFKYSFRGIEITKKRCGSEFQSELDQDGDERLFARAIEAIVTRFK